MGRFASDGIMLFDILSIMYHLKKFHFWCNKVGIFQTVLESDAKKPISLPMDTLGTSHRWHLQNAIKVPLSRRNHSSIETTNRIRNFAHQIDHVTRTGHSVWTHTQHHRFTPGALIGHGEHIARSDTVAMTRIVITPTWREVCWSWRTKENPIEMTQTIHRVYQCSKVVSMAVKKDTSTLQMLWIAMKFDAIFFYRLSIQSLQTLTTLNLSVSVS